MTIEHTWTIQGDTTPDALNEWHLSPSLTVRAMLYRADDTLSMEPLDLMRNPDDQIVLRMDVQVQDVHPLATENLRIEPGSCWRWMGEHQTSATLIPATTGPDLLRRILDQALVRIERILNDGDPRAAMSFIEDLTPEYGQRPDPVTAHEDALTEIDDEVTEALDELRAANAGLNRALDTKVEAILRHAFPGAEPGDRFEFTDYCWKGTDVDFMLPHLYSHTSRHGDVIDKWDAPSMVKATEAIRAAFPSGWHDNPYLRAWGKSLLSREFTI
ncbi:hypothetical protein [Aeromicrobium sp. 179-A 4D2 NHS]|uniref:hypothetical protein n=1 Tax=Aeromicrobium sp. 179-A 4D2 NHS TaxID=3142375 RepID=UPI00399EF574